MKKLLTSIVALCMLFTMCFVGAIDASAAKYEINWDDWDIEDGVLYGYWGEEVPNLVIPSMDQFGTRVTLINSSAFLDATYLENVIISEGIEQIGGAAFAGCTNLKTVSLPASLTSFTWGTCFQGCSSLESIVIPGGISEIPVSNFSECSSLEEIIFTPGGEDVTIRICAFNATNPRKVVLTDNVVTIHSTAFYNLELIGNCELIFCNPNVALGGGEDNLGGVAEPNKPILGVREGYEVNGEVTVTYLEGSTAQKWFEETMFNYNGEAGVECPPYPKKNVKTSATYFESLEENQVGYGKPYVAPNEEEIYEMFLGDAEPDVDPFANVSGLSSDTTSGTDGNSNNNTNGGGTTTVVQGGDMMGELMPILIIAGCIFGGLILIIIIVVVIIVVVNANKKKKRRAARAAKLAAAKAAEAAPEAEVAEPAAEDAVAEEVFDEPEAPAEDAE